MRGWMLIGGFVGGLLACSASTGFACMEDSECTLSGEPGVCAGGNCAYPSETCESGYVYPDGAPGNLAGMCADVEGDTGSDPDTDTGPSESTGPGESSDGTTIALDDGTTSSDDTTTSVTTVASSGGMESESGEGSSSGGCDGVDVYLEPLEDAFMSDTCPMMACEIHNFGATDLYPVGETDMGERSVMAIRFDTGPIMELMLGQLQTAELELYYELDNNEVNGTYVVGALSSEYPWVEGDQSGSPANDGESCWDAAQYPDLPWPPGGPTGAVAEELGQIELADMIGQKTIVIPLDVTSLTSQFLNGAESVLLYGSVDNLDLYVASRESGQPPRLHLIGC